MGRILAVCVAVALLAACHRDSSPAPVAKAAPRVGPPATAKPGPTPEELTAGMVEAVTVDSSTVPVGVKFELSQRPIAGRPLDVVVAVMPQIAAGPAILQVIGSDELKFAPGGGPIEMPSVEANHVYRHDIKVIPAAEGVQLLRVRVSLNHDEITETRDFSVPLIVAASAAATGDH